MDIIGASHPFYKSNIRRYAIVAVCLIWAAIEWYFNNPFWAVIATGVFGLAAYELIWTYKLKHGDPSQSAEKSPDAKS